MVCDAWGRSFFYGTSLFFDICGAQACRNDPSTDGAMSQEDTDLLKNQELVDRFSQDLTKWELCDRAGNIFNRLILFNAHNYHMSMDYFGDTKETGRLFQVFFFSTER